MKTIKRFKTLVLFAVLMPLMAWGQGWPAQYGGVMLQGFYWNSNFYDYATLYPSSYTYGGVTTNGCTTEHESNGSMINDSWYSIPNGADIDGKDWGWNHGLNSENAWRQWSAPNTRWATLTANINEIADWFDVIWVPQSGANTAPKEYVAYTGQPNPDCMGFVPVYWFNHGKTDTNGNYYTATWHAPKQDKPKGTYWDTEESAEIKSWFGTEQELKDMIAAYKARGTAIIEDVILNHKGGLDYWSTGWFADCTTDAEKIQYYNNSYKQMSYNFPWETSHDPESTYMQDGYDITWSSRDIVNEDKLFSSPIASWFSASDKGAADTADNGGWARDLDHTSAHVQYNINKYLDFLLNTQDNNGLGYSGLRIDYVKGFSGKYMGLFLGNHTPTFSVGECYDGNASGTVIPWIQSTYRNGFYQSAAFDFPLKLDCINPAFNNGEWDKLNDGVALINKENDTQWRRYSVTFVDNHDTFKHLPHDITNYRDRVNNRIMGANAFILSMPGTPCVFYPHYMNPDWRPSIRLFIQARRAAGITNMSGVFGDSDNSASGGGWRVVGDNGSLRFECGDHATNALADGYVQVWAGDDCRLSIMLANESRTGTLTAAEVATEIAKVRKQNLVNGYPIIDKPSGHYQNTVDVTIRPNNGDVKIVYTVDGTEPSKYGRELPANGTTLTIGSNMTVKAGVLVDGEVPPSTVITRRYIVNAAAATASKVYVYKDDGWSNPPYLYAWDAVDTDTKYTSDYPGWQYYYTQTVGGIDWYHATINSTNFYAQLNWGDDTKTPDLGPLSSDVFYMYQYGGKGVVDVTNAFIDMIHNPTVAIDKGSGSYIGNLTIQLDASNPDDYIAYVVNKTGETATTLTTGSNNCQSQRQITLTAPGEYTVQAAMVHNGSLINRVSRVYNLTQAGIKVYVKNMTTTAAPQICYWGVSGYSNSGFPGEPLSTTETVAGQTWYVMEFTGAQSANFLFSLGDATTQTDDINPTSSGEYFYYYYPAVKCWNTTAIGRGVAINVTSNSSRTTTTKDVTFGFKGNYGQVYAWNDDGWKPLGAWSSNLAFSEFFYDSASGYNYITFLDPPYGGVNIKIHDGGGETSGTTWYTSSTNFNYSGGSSVSTSTGVNRIENPTAVVVTPSPINIYVKTKGDVQPKGHYWNGNGDITTWPGELMTATEIDGDVWYQKTFTDQTSVSFLINNNGDADKTGNIENVTAGDHYYYYNGDGEYWDVTEPVPSIATVQVGKTYVYFVNEKDWPAPYIYSFTEVGGSSLEVNGAWPGQLLDEPVGISPDGHAIYLIEFTGDVPTTLIFSNDGDKTTQTYDLEFVNGGYFTNASEGSASRGGDLVGVARGVASKGDDTQIVYTTWTLAQIIQYGTVGDYYIVANDVTVGYDVDGSTFYIKDTNTEGIQPSFPDDEYVRRGHVYDKIYKGNQELNFDQSNWARLELKSGQSLSGTTQKFIQGGTILCQFTDAVNPTLVVVSDVTPVLGDADNTFFMNEYCPANFSEQPAAEDDGWFFVKPRISEFCKIRWAVYDAATDAFYTPESTGGDQGTNGANIGGCLKIGQDLRAVQDAFIDGAAYKMTAIIHNTEASYPGRSAVARRIGVNKDITSSDGIDLILLTAETSTTITGVDDIDAVREPVNVRYINLQGMQSQKPFDGVNIVITTYSDGTSTTSKVLN